MKNIKILTIIILSLALFATLTEGQTTSTFVAGMKAPVKIIYARQQGYFLVSEAGDPQIPNSGRISLVTNQGARFTLLDGLPSGPSAPNDEVSGPSAIWLNGTSLYVAIGSGNAVLNGPFPGTEVPNPHPNSPLFSSVLEFQFHSFGAESENLDYQLQPADHLRLANGETIRFGGKGRLTAFLRLAGNFPDFTPEPRPGVPNNVRVSNPFGLVLTGNMLYIADASQNMIRTINPANGVTGTLVTFPPRPNPGMPPPPFIDAVPDGLRLVGNQLLVPLLTGFPFLPQFSEIRSVDLTTGTDSLFIGGLTTAVDVLPLSAFCSFCHEVYTLEISTNLLMGAPGRLQRFTSPTSSTVIANNLISPTSMALQLPGGDIFVTEIFTGRIIRVTTTP